MKLHNELPVYKATYDMLLEIFQLCRNFPFQSFELASHFKGPSTT